MDTVRLSRKLIFISVFVIFPFNMSHADELCLKWFRNSGISANSRDCILKCDILPKDMTTFDCADQCDDFCKSKICKPDSYWKSKIKNGRPANWDPPVEISIEWKDSERKRLLELLGRLPDELKIIPFDGFYRMKKSAVLTNPGTTASTGDKVAVYDRAFDNPYLSTSRVIIHELGHVLYQHFTDVERQSYRDLLKWKENGKGHESRAGNFISSRAKDSADEDFAENINFFLFEPAQLKSSVPLAYDWISRKFSKNFKLKEDCQDDKK